MRDGGATLVCQESWGWGLVEGAIFEVLNTRRRDTCSYLAWVSTFSTFHRRGAPVGLFFVMYVYLSKILKKYAASLQEGRRRLKKEGRRMRNNPLAPFRCSLAGPPPPLVSVGRGGVCVEGTHGRADAETSIVNEVTKH